MTNLLPSLLLFPSYQIKAMSQLSSECNLDHDLRSNARRVAESLCASLLNFEASDTLYSALANPMQAKVVIDAIAIAAPSPQSFKLSARVAFRIHSLLKGKSGLTIVQILISNARSPVVAGRSKGETREAEAEEGLQSQAGVMMRDLCCMIALQSRAFLLSSALSPDPRGPALVECLLDRMIEEQEGAWVATIAQDLLTRGKTPPSASSLFSLSLSLSYLLTHLSHRSYYLSMQ